MSRDKLRYLFGLLNFSGFLFGRIAILYEDMGRSANAHTCYRGVHPYIRGSYGHGGAALFS
jgi:hypothetical protein